MTEYDPTDLALDRQLTPVDTAEQIVTLEAYKKKIDEKISILKEKLLRVTKEQGVLTLKTEKYVITRAKRQTVTINDHALAAKELEAKNVPVQTKVVLSDFTEKALKELAKQGTEFDSVTVKETEYLAIKIN